MGCNLIMILAILDPPPLSDANVINGLPLRCRHFYVLKDPKVKNNSKFVYHKYQGIRNNNYFNLLLLACVEYTFYPKMFGLSPYSLLSHKN
jgi:hypothetical protein